MSLASDGDPGGDLPHSSVKQGYRYSALFSVVNCSQQPSHASGLVVLAHREREPLALLEPPLPDLFPANGKAAENTIVEQHIHGEMLAVEPRTLATVERARTVVWGTSQALGPIPHVAAHARRGPSDPATLRHIMRRCKQRTNSENE